MRKILVPIDGSEASNAAIRALGPFIKGCTEVEILSLYVTTQNLYFLDTVIPYNALDMENQYVKQVEEEIQFEFLKYWNTHVRFIHRIGHPVQAICELADAEKIDLIVMGSHGRGSLNHLLLGSVSHALVNQAKVPVFIVKG